MQVYQGMISIPKEGSFNRGGWELTAKLWCWSLNQLEKCVYLEPASFVSEHGR
jgi:hypothetical protein